jgi:lysophospholipid acyltransferase (LPLAT)-like uncharacterized protein
VGSLATVSASIASAVLCGYLRSVGRSLRVAFSFPGGAVCSGNDPCISEFFEKQRQDGPVIYALWISDHVALLSIGFASSFLRRLAQRFAFVADDSFGGLVMRSAVTALGARILPVSVQDATARLRSLRLVVQERSSTFVAVDGHGPYFTVPPGLVSLAKSIGAAVVPFAVLTVPAVRMTNFRVSVALPLPRSRVLSAFGEAIRFHAPSNLRAVDHVRIISEALQSVRQHGREVLHNRWPS